ncbi:hypothetical protein PPERSA_01288 [Pseudocohnilembus persalinus]|uniref:Transmembrane protein n=1 Tax=Pseudocohnilembus persalinus TaxID=266149 RepID=A0A0V0QGQ4_PSEPJ|nr:hypothetical protein PPERSA_01288 [Pseudocohnilembus persalinus]|eukprot:KRX01385.1 hypothetical protein PPERSA_01288 [Pseudocohnilembus persalinus]
MNNNQYINKNQQESKYQYQQNEHNNDISLQYQQNNQQQISIQQNNFDDIEQNKLYPHSIVWTALPCITCMCPCIGHTGIADQEGIIYDFAGPYYIGKGNLAFGQPLKYVKLDKNKMDSQNYDNSVMEANQSYVKQVHNLCFNNCHSHVARALNNMKYNNKSDWTMVSVCMFVFFCGKFVDFKSVLKVYIPFFIFLILIGLIIYFIAR